MDWNRRLNHIKAISTESFKVLLLDSFELMLTNIGCHDLTFTQHCMEILFCSQYFLYDNYQRRYRHRLKHSNAFSNPSYDKDECVSNISKTVNVHLDFITTTISVNFQMIALVAYDGEKVSSSI